MIDDLGALHFRDYIDLTDTCKYGRMPPLSPDTVLLKLQEEKKFSTESDASKVASLYKRFFDAVSTSTETLEFWT